MRLIDSVNHHLLENECRMIINVKNKGYKIASVEEQLTQGNKGICKALKSLEKLLQDPMWLHNDAFVEKERNPSAEGAC
jgi:hypothetical protein